MHKLNNFIFISIVIFQFCKTSPYVYERVKQIKVTIGNDGTNDNVKELKTIFKSRSPLGMTEPTTT